MCNGQRQDGFSFAVRTSRTLPYYHPVLKELPNTSPRRTVPDNTGHNVKPTSTTRVRHSKGTSHTRTCGHIAKARRIPAINPPRACLPPKSIPAASRQRHPHRHHASYSKPSAQKAYILELRARTQATCIWAKEIPWSIRYLLSCPSLHGAKGYCTTPLR